MEVLGARWHARRRDAGNRRGAGAACWRAQPDHTGANHYYIHAVEASPHPEKALASAKRLETLAPSAGHLVHMPAHIYIRTGNYLDAARANVAAVRADERRPDRRCGHLLPDRLLRSQPAFPRDQPTHSRGNSQRGDRGGQPALRSRVATHQGGARRRRLPVHARAAARRIRALGRNPGVARASHSRRR